MGNAHGLLHSLFQVFEKLFVLPGSAAIEPCGKNGDDFQNVPGKIFFKACIFSLIKDDHFHLSGFADGKNQFRAKAKQAVFVGEKLLRMQNPDVK